ncbi:peptidase T [Sedimentibacter sp. zth1]|uniref:peptidase T n=1 Tax=Sedimentibacter sp. zth1 TaxID=2816908 RepID=UPI001A938054|nr:peptidase T [Sedimentibacter sp. zth1]QSX06285.1 peptidase T [Sedimentibacter sp. zth1]
MKNILDRFLDYTMIDTQSAYNPKTVPSTEKQKDLGRILVDELKKMGAEDAYMSDNACVYGTIPANYDNCKAPSIGFSSHLDTTPELSGKNVKAKVVKNYDGKDIVLNKQENIVMEVSKFPHMKNYIGNDLVVTDGTTLLGADDKAGLAEIMNMAQYFYENPNVKHGEIQFFFPCDEEIGCFGTKQLDKSKFSPTFAYTLDGGPIGEITYECFNAAEAKVKIKGVNIHPGLSKNQMKNSILIAKEFLNMLPDFETPGHTENYEGYYHIIDFLGEVELTNLRFYLRDHDKAKFEVRKNRIKEISEYLNKVYGENTVEFKVNDTYGNMSEMILPHFEIVEAIQNAMKSVEVKPFFIPMRGGTDGSIMSFMGIPCPNICTGGHNFHGRYEYVPVQSMEKISSILIEIVKSFAK